MSNVYFNVLSSLNENVINIEALIMIVILTLVYKELITVAESMSSELVGTQNMGTAPQSSLIGGLVGAGMGMASMAYSAYKSPNSPSSLGGGILKGTIGLATASATGVTNLASKGGVAGWNKVSPENRRYQSALKNLSHYNDKASAEKRTKQKGK